MRPLSDYNSIPEYTEVKKIPAGAYEVLIKRAEEKEINGSIFLCILFDIFDGEYKNFFMDKFIADRKKYPETAKFKGIIRFQYPDGKNPDYDEDRKKRMKTALECIKRSNNLNADFSKFWDGAILKDCKAGMIFRDEEYDYNGYHGMSARPYCFIDLEDFKAGKYTVPEPKYLSGKAPASAPANSSAPSQSVDELVEDLPF